MYCPNCNSENSDSAKFCKKCGTPLKKTIDHKSMINSISEGKSKEDNTTKYIIIALAIIAIVLACVFAYVGFAGHNDDSQDNSNNIDLSLPDSDNTTAQASQPTQTSQSTSSSKSMSIYGGSFSTGSGLSDKTYASIYVGEQHSGEKVKIQIKYSRDGSSLNKGNMVPKTVGSDGYINVKSAESYKYYPDKAVINIFDTSGNLLTTQTVYLNTDSGTQYF